MFFNVPGITGKSTIARAVKASFDEEVAFVTSLVKAPSPNPYTPQDSPLHQAVEGDVPRLIFDKLKEIGLLPKYVGASRERMNVE